MSESSTDIRKLATIGFFSPREEVYNSITHGIGVVLSVAGLTILVTLASLYGDAWRIVSFSIYGITLTMLYICSTLYHMFRIPRIKEFFRLMDHVMIYILIAGSYTPLTLVNLRGPWGWSLFGVIWALAIIGVIFKIYSFKYGGKLAAKVSTWGYILMGWLAIVAIPEMIYAIPFGGLVWLLIGGFCYTFGVIFFAWEAVPHNHAIWHLFVLAGSIAHFFAMLFYVLPMEMG